MRFQFKLMTQPTFRRDAPDWQLDQPARQKRIAIGNVKRLGRRAALHHRNHSDVCPFSSRTERTKSESHHTTETRKGPKHAFHDDADFPRIIFKLRPRVKEVMPATLNTSSPARLVCAYTAPGTSRTALR